MSWVQEIATSPLTEQSLLGAAFLRPDVVGWLDVSSEEFADFRHRAVWQAMRGLHAEEKPIDPVTVEGALRRDGSFEAVGGPTYLAELALAVPSAEAAPHYASELGRHWVTRQTVEALSGALTRIRRGEASGEEALDEAVRSLGQIRRGRTGGATSVGDLALETIRELGADVDARARGEEAGGGLATGIESLDAEVGGVVMGSVTAVAARQGEGKSTLMLNLGHNVAARGERAVLFTLEDPRRRWMERLISRLAGVRLDRVYRRTLDAHEMHLCQRAADELRKLSGLHIVPAHGWSVDEITRCATSLRAGLVGVDYVQKIRSPKGLKLHEAVRENSIELGIFAGRTGAAVVVAAQLKQEVEKEQRKPRLSDMRYGEGLADECKLALLLHDPRDANDPNRTEITIPKQNQGERHLVVEVEYRRAFCEFR